MGLYKQCRCKGKDSCEHPWHAQSRGKRISLERWAKRPIRNKTEAKKAFAEMEAAVLAGTFFRGPAKQGYSVENLADEYRDDYFLPRGRNYEHAEKYRFELIKKSFGPADPNALNTADVEKWVNGMRRNGVGPGGIQRNVARLKAILNWGWTREKIQMVKVRWKALDLEPEGQGRARRLEEGEELRLKAAASPWLKDLIETALDTGLRAGALLGLRFSMVDGSSLVVPRRLLKNKRATHNLRIPLTRRVQQIVANRRGDLGPEAFIFGTRLGTGKKDFRGLWDKTRQDAGVRRDPKGGFELRWHDLRGEFATRLHEAGTPIETISYLLDHSTLQMTMRYVKQRTRSSKPAEAIQALELLQEAFEKAVTTPSSPMADDSARNTSAASMGPGVAAQA